MLSLFCILASCTHNASVQNTTTHIKIINRQDASLEEAGLGYAHPSPPPLPPLGW